MFFRHNFIACLSKYFLSSYFLILRPFVFDPILQLLNDLGVICWFVLVKILENFSLIDCNHIFSLAKNIEVECLHVLLADVMAERNKDICAFF